MRGRERGADGDGTSLASVHHLNRNDALMAIAESSPDTIILVDTEGRILFVNRIHPGFSAEEVLGSSIYDYVASDVDVVRATVTQVARTGQPSSYEVVAHDTSGQPTYWESRVSAVHDPQGEVVQLAIIASDVTERRAHEVERRRLLDLSIDLICVANVHGRFFSVNQAFMRVLGHDEEFFLRTSFMDLIHPDDLSHAQAALGRIAEGESVQDVEARFRHADGSYRWLSWSGLADPETGRVYSTGRDITELRAAAERQRQAQKMNAVGRLAGGIAHDFNNLLQVVLANNELMQAASAPDGPHSARLEQVSQACLRGQALVRQLLAFSRPQTDGTEALDLHALARSVVSLVERLMPDDVHVTLECGPDPLSVEGNRSQLEQVVLNLCVNARDAMPQGGVIRVSTCESRELEGARSACLAVEDEGAGVPETLRESIFEPFFTTKGAAGGSGLGLSMAYGILQRHGGTLQLDDSRTRGARFRVLLPMTEARPAPDVTSEAPQGRGHTGVVLIAEDQEAVREVTVDMLTSAGFRVHAARDGVEAIELMERHGAEVDAVLLDVVMPRLGGPEAWQHIQARWPHVRAVFATGYADSERLAGLAEQGVPLLEKPYRARALLELVERACGIAEL